jgi:hypothetical protein
VASPNYVSLWRDYRVVGVVPNRLQAGVDPAPVILVAPGIEIEGIRGLGSAYVVVAAPGVTFSVPPFAYPAPIVIHAPALQGVGVERFIGSAPYIMHAPSIVGIGTEQFYQLQQGGLVLGWAPDVTYTGGVFEQFAALGIAGMVAHAPALVENPQPGAVPIIIYAPAVTMFADIDATHQGFIYRTTDDIWANIRDAASGQAVQQTTTVDMTTWISCDPTVTDDWDDFRRTGITFGSLTDTIPSGSYLHKATLRLRVAQTTIDEWGNGELVIVSFAPATSNSYVTGDYDAFGEVSYGKVALADVPASGNDLEIPLNGDALNALNTTGSEIVLGLRIGFDAFDAEPTWTADYDAFFEHDDLVNNPPVLKLNWSADPITFIRPAPAVLASPQPNVYGGTISVPASYQGRVARTPADETWTQIRDTATATGVSDSAATDQYVHVGSDSAVTDEYDAMARTGITWDLSASGIPADATITQATVRLMSTDNQDEWTGGQVGLVAFTPADPDAYATGDYDAFGTTDFATRQNITAFNGSDVDFALNATGLAAISPAGTEVVLGLRVDYDIDDSEPSPWVASRDAFARWQSINDDAPLLILDWVPAQYVSAGTVTWVAHAPTVTTTGGA